MGCDIHPCVEIKGEDGKWKAVKPSLPESRYGEFRGGAEYGWQWDFDRNYNAFALMADVRNDGFIIPIDTPRGLPPDVTPEIREELDCADYHSISWLGLPEILQAISGGELADGGLVDERGFKHYLEKGSPNMWCGSVFVDGLKIVSNEQMKAIVEGREPREKGAVYFTEIRWNTPIKQSVFALVKLVEMLKKLGDPERIRVVFGFDN